MNSELTIYPKLITDALATVRYPGTGKNIVEAGMVEDNIRINGMKVSFSLIFEKATDPFMKSLIKSAETAIHTHVGKDVETSPNSFNNSVFGSFVRKLITALIPISAKDLYPSSVGCAPRYNIGES